MMQRNRLAQPPPMEGAAPNALLAPRQPQPQGPPQPQPQQEQADPFKFIEEAARRAGVDPERASPEDVLGGAWKAQPTDEMGEAIDAVARHLGVSPPWAKQRR